MEKKRKKGQEKEYECNDLFKAYPYSEYPEVESVDFPRYIFIAFAVCGKKCGAR